MKEEGKAGTGSDQFSHAEGSGRLESVSLPLQPEREKQQNNCEKEGKEEGRKPD